MLAEFKNIYKGMRKMNDRQLKSFIKIVETGSFSKAAQEDFISVPAIVQQIDRLEETLGFQLFLRTNQGIMLTDNGKVFYQAVLQIQEIYENAVTQIRNKEHNCINIGVASGQCPEFLINVCTVFRERYTGTVLHFIELPYEQHLDMLRQGRIDITVIAQPKKMYLKGLEYLELCRDTYAFGVNDNDKLALKERISRDDLSNREVLCGTYYYMEKPFEKLLCGTAARLQTLNTEYNLESVAQAKLGNAMLVFHSHWKNCYSHMCRIISSDIDAGSIGVVIRKGEKKRLENLYKCWVEAVIT